MMQLTNKRINKIEASYTLEGAVLENVDSIKYLGVTITNDLKWNTHINNICTKANRTLGFLRRNLFSCPLDVKEAAYKGLVHPRPVLECLNPCQAIGQLLISNTVKLIKFLPNFSE